MAEELSIQDKVFNFIEDRLRVRRSRIDLNKSINFDLGMDGDDAVEFFEAFAEQFEVDLKPLGEEWDRYFYPEGFGLSELGNPQILTLFTARKHYSATQPLEISRLVIAVEVRKWIPTKE